MPPAHGLAIDDFIAEYGAHVDAQSAALFVGAGLSILSGYPSWSGLVEPYANELGVTLDDFPLVVQYFQDSRTDGVQRVREDILNMVRLPGVEPSEAHDRLLALPVPDVWTTNFDELIERAAARDVRDVQVFAEDEDLAHTRPAMKRVYKMHGSVRAADASADLVISRDDFERYPTSHPRLWQLLRAHFLTRSVLFLGFSLTDPNITEIFRLARLDTPTVQRPHYAVLKRVSGAGRRLAELRLHDLARVGVRIVEIEEHNDVVTVLARLNARCRPPRAYVSGSIAPDSPAADWTATFSDELGRLLAAQREVRLMSGGITGARVGYEMSRYRHKAGIYRSDDFVVVRRVRDEEMTAPNTRWGSVVFDGETAEFLRSAAFEQVRAVVVLGGSEGTRDEIRQAKALGMGVIAVGGTGGAAAAQWAEDMASVSEYRLGERPVDADAMKRLDDPDPVVAAVAAVGLITQALFLA